MTTIAHVAPFDPSRYPPLLSTLAVTASHAAQSVVVSSIEPSSAAKLHGAELRFSDRAMGGFGQVEYLAGALKRLCADVHLDLIVAHNVRGLLATTLVGPLGAPVVYHCHDFETRTERSTWALDAIEPACSRTPDETWVPAEERVPMARARGNDGKIHVVRNCPPRLAMLPARGRLRAWLATRGVSADARVLIRAGRIGRVHYVLETVHALARLPKDVHFVVLGEGDDVYIAECVATARELGLAARLHFHPFVPHQVMFEMLVDANAAMNVYVPMDVNSSTPAPNKVYESMAFGLPSLVAEGNSVAVDVVSAGAGIAVRCGDADALVAGLARLLDERAFAEAARAAHLSHFHYEAQLNATLLDRVLRAGR